MACKTVLVLKGPKPIERSSNHQTSIRGSQLILVAEEAKLKREIAIITMLVPKMEIHDRV